jgi:hypothetical protein
VVRSLYPIVSIFELTKRSGEVPATRLEGHEDALVLRPRLKVEVRCLPQGGAPFVLALKENKTLGEAAAAAAEKAPSFVLETMLAGLIASGAIISIGPGADPKL